MAKEVENNLLTNKFYMAQSGILTISSYTDFGAGNQIRYSGSQYTTHNLGTVPIVLGFVEISGYTYTLPFATAANSTGYLTSNTTIYADDVYVYVQAYRNDTTTLSIRYYLFLDKAQ